MCADHMLTTRERRTVMSEEVLESARYIASLSRDVSISHEAVDQAATKIFPLLSASLPEDTIPTLEPPDLSPNELLEWIFLLDTLNFCFWSDEDVLFTCNYGGVEWTGYCSLCAALTKAVEDGVPVYRPSFYRNITKEQLCSIFRSETHVALPLLERRLENLHEAAEVLEKEFSGKVSELIQRSQKSVQNLVSLLVRHFPSYRDVSFYKGRKVWFLKRAQIFGADLWQRFGGCGYGEFHDIDTLTMFADYRVPQCLLYLGVLLYSNRLMDRLSSGDHLAAGDEMEAEIRGCSVWAVELLRQKLLSLIKGDDSLKVNAVLIDFFLWNYAKSNSSAMRNWPIHRTLTIFY